MKLNKTIPFTISSLDITQIEPHEWHYQGGSAQDPTPDLEGFVYKITNMVTGQYYIGKKSFWTRRTLAPLKGKTRKRHVTRESNWREYWGSCDQLIIDVLETGMLNYSREILALARTKGELNYLEAKAQFEHDVLRDPLAYNGIINCKIHHTHLPK